ncbi:hypothetical protein DL93DRAFT_2137769 [Clavulina sp. PMI_390]|nr:hypothetical protein DL93DRAFT_2137769 [Clavulina sp. PMI_390]
MAAPGVAGRGVSIDSATKTISHAEEDHTSTRSAESDASLVLKEEFDCSVCMDNIPMIDGVQVPGCGHKFCRKCLRNYLEIELQDKIFFPILCPNCRAEGTKDPASEFDSPTVPVPSSLAEDIGLDNIHYKSWGKLGSRLNSAVIDCPDCQNSFLVSEEDYEASQILNCPVGHCGRRWCKSCDQKVEFEVFEHACDGEKEFQEWISQRDVTRCPECGLLYEIASGSPHMICYGPGCNTHFCCRDGQLITKSKNPQEVRIALEQHFSICRPTNEN